MTIRRRMLRVLAWGCLALLMPFAAHATPTDFNFKDVELANIFQTIAVLGKFNVIIDPQVARAKMVVSLKQVEPLDALFLVSKIQELKVKRVKWEEGSTTTTYAIGRPDKIEKSFEQANSRTVQLKYAKAEDVAGILAKGLGKDVNIGVERDPRTNRLLLKGTEDVLTKVMDLVKDLDLPVPQVLLDSKIVDVQSTYTRNLGFDWSFGVGATAPTKVGTPASGTVAAITEFLRINPNADAFNQPAAAQGASFFKFGDFFRQNLFFTASLDVLESKGLTRTLAAPRLLAIQGSQAQLNIGDKIVFSGGPSQPPEERDTGLIMEITPRVNSDNFITMAIRVEQSSATFERPDFPTINRTATKTEVQVRDGEEVLVGGLVREVHADTERKVAFLGDLPILKHLFTKKNKNPRTQELVILVTPHVVKQSVTAAVDSEAPGPRPGGGGLPPAGGGDPLGGGDLDLGGDLGPGPTGSASPRPSPQPSASGAGGGDLDLEGI